MRKQIAAANWKMNLTLQQAESLMDELLEIPHELKENQEAVFGVPFPYLINIKNKLAGKQNAFVAAQNCYDKKSGAYTGEVSAEMLKSIDVEYVILGTANAVNILTKAMLCCLQKLIFVWSRD